MLTGILTVAIQLLGWFLKKAEIKQESLKVFYEWAEKLGSELGSAKLREYGLSQMDWLNKNPWKETK